MLDAALKQDPNLDDEIDAPVEDVAGDDGMTFNRFSCKLLCGQSRGYVEGVFSSLRREGS